jgi:hypothetical protein
MTLSKRSKVSVGLVITLASIAVWAGKTDRQVDSNTKTIEKMQTAIKETAENVSYLRGQWDERYKPKNK